MIKVICCRNENAVVHLRGHKKELIRFHGRFKSLDGFFSSYVKVQNCFRIYYEPS